MRSPERAKTDFLSNRGQSDLERKADTQIGGTRKARDYLSENHVRWHQIADVLRC